jgi:general secretion pathway protein I
LKARGFTLLEVMVAVAILGLSLTVILSAQAGLYSGGAYAQHTSVAVGLARCRMTELEERLAKLGYPEVDTNDDGACCEDDSRQDMRCSWKIERVELPQAKPPDLSPASSSGAMSLGGSAFGAPPGGSPPGGAAPGAGGPLGALTQLATNPGALSGDAGIGGIASTLTQSMGGAGGIESMAMTFVYPMLKPMLEASIRKLTVKVSWHEGTQNRDITIVQYVTRPMKPPPALAAGASSAGGSPLDSLFGAGSPLGGAVNPLGGALPGANPLAPPGSRMRSSP